LDTRENDTQYRSLVDLSPDAIVVHRSGKILYTNRAGLHLFKVPMLDTLLGRRILDFVHPDDLPEVVRRIAASEGNQVTNPLREFRLIIDDTIVYCETIGGPVMWNGEPAVQVIIRDISDRKRAESRIQELLQKVTEEKERLSSLVNSVTDEIWFTDTEKRFSLANPAALKEFELTSVADTSAEKLVEALEILEPDGSPRPPERAQPLRALKGEVIRNEEEIVRTPATGELRYRQVSASPVRDSSGTIIGSVTVVRDITELKKTEEALKQSEAKYRTVADNTYDWESWTDPEGRFIFCSPSCKRITGHPVEEFLAEPLLRRTLIHPEDRWGFDRHIHDAEAQRKSGEGEWRILRPDGTWRWISHVCRPVFDENSGYLGVRGSDRDITERKQAEELLKESQERLQGILDNSVDALYRRNLLTGRFEYYSPAIERITGFAVQEVLGMDTVTILERVHPDDMARVRAEKLEVPSSLTHGTVDHRFLRKDGTYVWVSDHFRILYDEEGRAVVREGVIRDITERKKVEETVQQYVENLKRSNEDLERFAYIASHDLQEPLRNVVSFSQLLSRRYQGKLGADADEYIGYIVEGGKRMQILVQDLLEYSRVNTRGQAFGSVSCEEVIAQVIKNLQTAITENEATIQNHPLPTVLADPTQLPLVFQNLLGNAIKFRRQDEPPSISISAKKTGDWWTFAVQDNGIGIDSAFYDRIFVIFQRLHGRNEYPGTGVGLAIVKKIIERHRGRIWVESEVGKGSTFYFTLPAVPGTSSP
jgi:PAS domain S-box